MRARWLVAGWLIVAAAVWNGFYDILITRGAKAYLMLSAIHRAGEGPEPSLQQIMAQTSHDASITASGWAAFVLAAGCVTIGISRRRRSS